MHGMHFTLVKRGAKCSSEANAARPLVRDVASPDCFASHFVIALAIACLLYTSPSPRDSTSS
eukprot:5783758-Prorocentrum_lima.AAC.1